MENLEIKVALHWTEEINPDLPPPDGYNKLSKGFLFNEYEAGRVEPACSSRIYHAFGRDDYATSKIIPSDQTLNEKFTDAINYLHLLEGLFRENRRENNGRNQ